MYNCPNCSGNLVYDIASKKLMCEYCKTQLDPYEYQKTQDAEEDYQRDGSRVLYLLRRFHHSGQQNAK